MWAADAKVKKDIPLTNVKKGEEVTITRGLKYKYALWGNEGVFDLPAEYIDKSSIVVFSHK